VDVFSAHYPVVGFDVSPKRVEQLRAAERGRAEERSVRYESDPSALARATHFLVSVPTLLRPDRSVDMSYLESALKTVGTYGRTGATVVIESSVSIGATRNLLGPLAAERGFLAGMSPEVRGTP
jgi:UDP-N-acetyl-D-mannosaminuronate dehydrogenase